MADVQMADVQMADVQMADVQMADVQMADVQMADVQMADRDEFNNGMILPALIKQLKSILQQYPDDGQILKELIQNAEDAKARKIIFLLDRTTYPARPEKLHNPDLAPYQGLALYVYNDAVFTRDDWRGIRMINDSVKQKDPMKVGRFGLGFKSVFHMTNLPSIFSGNGIGFLDPHELFFTTDIPGLTSGYRTSSYLWDLQKNKDDIRRLEDQFLPFHQELFGVTSRTFSDGYYKGTMFRFPMRMEGMHSDLCDTKYDAGKVRELFRSLETDAHIMLLFLKSLECIEVYEKTSETASPTKIMSINISQNLTEEVRAKRLHLIKQIEAHRNGNVTDSVSVIYPLNVEFQKYQNNSPIETSKWIISQYYAGKSELDFEKEISETLGLLPWVGAALPIQENSENPSYLAKPKGHIFCFLPLPLEETSPTGLRVHVHGYFAVDSNRRHLKWPTADQKINQLTDQSLIWNEFLVNKLLVKALVKLALHVANPENRLRHDLIFDIIPDQLTPQWKYLAEEFCRQLPNLNIFYSPVSSGQWMNSRNAVFDNIEDKTELQALIRRILLQNQTRLVFAPKFLKNHFVNQITPKLVCESLKTSQNQISLNDHEKLFLLDYLLHNLENLADLIGVNLLPLEDGSWIDFKNFQHQERVYVDSKEHPKSLFPGLEKLFLRSDIQMIESLQKLAKLNITQLVFLTESSVPCLLRSVFPASWKNKAQAKLSEAQHVSVLWIGKLWNYLNIHFTSNLKDFEDMHILPIDKELVVQLNGEITLITSSHRNNTLEPQVKGVVKKLGIQIIDILPPSIQNHPCVLGKYIFRPDTTNEGLFGAIKKLQETKQLDIDCLKLTNAEKKVLQRFIASNMAGKSADVTMNRDILLSLPIFQTLKGSGFTPSQFVPLNVVNQAAPKDAEIPVDLPQVLLDLSEILVQDLADQLGVRRFTTVEVLDELVFPAIAEAKYKREDVVKLMSFVFDNFCHYQQSDCNFLSIVRNVRFIEKRDGSMVTARDVFDHCDQTLQFLFSRDDLFAVGEFANPRYSHILRQLGMKGQDLVTASDLVHVGEKLNLSENPDLMCAKTMLTFLENHPHLLDTTVRLNNECSKSLSAVLNRMKWIKCESKRPENYPESLVFVGDSDSRILVLPTEVYSWRFGSVIGSVRPTINTEETPNMTRLFGWLKEPKMEDVIKHLLNVISSYKQQQKLKFHFTVNEVYKLLNGFITSNVGTVLVEAWQDVDWVWHGEGFVAHTKMVKTHPFMDLKPHVFQLPKDFEEFSDLWNYFQLQENYNEVKVLKDIKWLHENSDCDEVQVNRDLHIAIEILKTVSVSNEKHELIPELFVPVKSDDGKLHLREINDVTYSDQDAFQDQVIESNPLAETIYLVHPLLPVETAKALNIHGIINRMLGTEDLDFESYGQSEPLTTRLSNILRDYPDGLAVLKELVQNADDAGATEVKFLYDERQNKDAMKGLIDNGMADLQGPAMWAYNDAVFTSQDFDNLIKLSGATKEQNRSKIGRFGLGFNAVYNLTDVPSLVSQSHIVFLDPHATFLGCAIRDRSKPGIKLDIRKNRDRIRLLPGQFKPYNGVFGCDFTADSEMMSYSGTLFRFPLRTPMQACTSEICRKHYSRDEVFALLKLLSESSHQFFLFTQHIRKISVYHLPHDASSCHDIKQWFVVEKRVEHIFRALNNLPQQSEDENAMNKQCGILDSVNKILTKSTYDEIPEIGCSFVIKITSTLENEASKVMKVDAQTETTHWLIATCMGRDDSFAMANRYTEHGLTPVGGVAAKLRQTDRDRFEPVNLVLTAEKGDAGEGGLLFCFLPLPIRSCFPVHINGSFAVTSSRMHLHENTVSDKEDIRGEWNEVLIADAIVKSYIILLEDLQKLCKDSNPYALWPVHKSLKEAGILQKLTDSLYSCICEENGPKLLKCEKFISVAECHFLEPCFRHQPEGVGRTAQKIFFELRSKDAVDIPLAIVDTVQQTNAWEKLRERLVDMTSFFETIFIPSIQVIREGDREELVLFALFDPKLIDKFRHVAFFPVRPHRKLKKCNEMVHPKSKLAILYDEENECFPTDVPKNCGRNQDDVYRRLVELGMKESDLSWEEIADRCLAVPEKPVLTTKRLSELIQLMSSKKFPVDESDTPNVEEIKKISFLPTAEKPRGFPLKWAGEDIKFTSCENSYLISEKSLVSCLFPIIDERQTFNFGHTELKSYLGLQDKPVLDKHLLLQLKHVIDLADCNGVTSGLQQEQKDHVKVICKDVYTRLDEYAKGNSVSEEVLDELKNARSIAIDKKGTLTFMKPSRCAFQLPSGVLSENILPYVCEIPRFLRSFDSLLRCLQVRQKFTITDYIEVLKSMHLNFLEEPLCGDDLRVALCIVNHCLVGETEDENIRLGDVFIPNKNKVLVPADKICYRDCVWFNDEEYDDDDAEETIHLCHPEIPQYAARKLGLKTIREEILDKYSCEMAFGQSERLVNRIRRILTGYPFDKEVLKEMLQNADDAGATEIHFINDTRQLPSERVFADKWKPMQGPALCIFNNKPFTKEDITGIQKLGEGSKSEDQTKTGQYGVGFNCVYHLTDAPTFLTNVVGDERVLCVFDPTCSFVPRATSANPGRMMTQIETLKEKFPDVFGGYFEETYGKEGGTMFRLPLRNEEIARNSELLNKVVTSKDVGRLFETFESVMFESLLFLNSVEEIHLKEVDGTGKLKTKYSVKVELSPDAKLRRQKFRENVKHFAEALKSKKMTLKNVPVSEVSYKLITKDSEGQEDTWHIIQRFGFEQTTKDSEKLIADCLCSNIELLPRAGIAYRTDSTRKNTNSSRLFCFLPLPVTIDFPVHVNGHFALEYETRRSLWIDDRGGPQVAWNKHMMTNIVAPAYCRLLEERRDAIHEAEDMSDYLANYHLLFPGVAEQDITYVKTLSVAIYKRIENKNLAILPLKIPTRNEMHGEKEARFWLGPQGTDDSSWDMWTKMGWKGSRGLNDISGHFDNVSQDVVYVWPGVNVTKCGSNESHDLVDTLVKCGFLVYDSPLNVYEKFKKAGVETKLIKPEAVLSFLQTYNKPNTLCQIKDLPKPICETPVSELKALISILRYCDGCNGLKYKLLGLPLQVTADDCLRRFDSALVKYEPRFKHIVPHIQEQFLHKSVFDTLSLNPKSDGQLCKKFTVENFAQVLRDVIPAATFYGENKFVDIQEMIAVFKDSSLKWLNEVWTFFSYYTEESPLNNHRLLPDKSNRKNTLFLNRNLSITNFKAVVKPLNNWCLLPVKFNKINALFPIQKYRSITTFDDCTFPTELRPILQDIGLPVPLPGILYTGNSIYDSVLREAEHAETIVRGFEELIKCVSPNITLENTECVRLLNYLSEYLDDWENVPNAFDTMRKLPIFVTVYDKRVSLWQSHAYIIPQGIPNNDMDSWTSTQGLVFLRSLNKGIDLLLERLGCKALSETNIYCSFIFKHFELLTPNGRYVHLKYVKDKLLINLPFHTTYTDRESSDQKALIQSLKLLVFLPRADGSLRRASEVYDNTNKVFLVMEQPDDHPPAPYNSWEWNDFLKTCGMIYFVTPEMFLKYAKTVELSALSSADEKLRKQSQILVYHFCKRDDILSGGFLENLKSVAFVFPHSVDQDHRILHTQYGERDGKGQLKFISFKGAVFSTSSTLVWSAQPILPLVALPLVSLSEGRRARGLDINDKPRCETVAKHTNQLCRKWVSSMQEFDEQHTAIARGREPMPILSVLASVLTDIYCFFKDNLDSIDDEVRRTLRETPLILDSNRRLLLRPDQCVEHLRPKDEIYPYLVRIPTELMKFEILFKALGSTEYATIDQYVMVLETIHTSTKDNILNPEEKKAAIKAIGKFFKRVQKHDGEIKLETELFLLGHDDRIHSSCDLVVDNSYAIRKRLPDFEKPFLIDLQKECNLRFSERQLESVIKKLPSDMQPSFLASIVKEELSRDFVGEESAFALMLQRKLHSDELKFGLMRLAHHRIATAEEFKEEDINKALESLHNINVIGVNKIECYLVFEGKRIQKSEQQVPFFMEQGKSDEHESWNIYINEKKLAMSYTAETSLYIKLVNCIQNMTGNLPENAVSFVSCMLKCDTNAFDEILDEFGIEQYYADRRSRRCVFQSPGEFLPLHLHHMLRQDVQCLIHGDCAALEVDDPLDRIRCRADLNNSVWPTYLVVKIVEVMEKESEPFTTIYKVESGCGEFMISNADTLYAFDLTAHNNCEVDHSSNADYIEMSLADMKKNIKVAFESTKNLPDNRRTKIIKRLLLRWHPDKNSESMRQMCVEATKYIWELEESLEQSDITSIFSQTLLPVCMRVNCSDRNFGWTIQKLYEDCVSFRAKQHKIFQEYHDPSGRQKAEYVDKLNDIDFEKILDGKLNPQPGLGRSWLLQAELDFNVVTEKHLRHRQWACHKYYQVALKSLKGCHYAMNASISVTEDIRRLANIHNDDDIMTWSSELHSILKEIFCIDLINHNLPMSYAIQYENPTKDTVKKVQRLSKNILDWCKKCITAKFGDTSFNQLLVHHHLEETSKEGDRKPDLTETELRVEGPSKSVNSHSEESLSESVTDAIAVDISKISISMPASSAGQETGNLEGSDHAGLVTLSKEKRRKRRKNSDQETTSKRSKALSSDSQ